MNIIKKLVLYVAISLLVISESIASLSVHPQELKDTVTSEINSTIPFHITNQGPSGNLSYQLSTSENWISFSSVSGDVDINETTEIELMIDVQNLSQGIHKANIVVGDPHHEPITVPIEILVNGVSDVYESSENNSLSMQVFPNPFHSTTTLNYFLPDNQNAAIKVLDIQGNLIKSIKNEFQSVGKHQLLFDGSELPSGIYFLTLNTSTFSIVKKLIINK